jgi:MtN3 and saliva related transmembrane protein
MMTDLIGMTGATLTTVCWVPQAVRIMRNRDTRAISIVGSATFTVGIIFWLIYGVVLADWPLIASNTVTLVLMLIIVAFKIRYG